MADILIIDDSRTSRRILREILENAGYSVIGEGINGEDAISMYRDLKPDLMTLDITMPVMDGLEALERIKEEDKNAKVVVITAAGQKEKMMRAIKGGAADFVTKPYEPEQVLGAIKHALE